MVQIEGSIVIHMAAIYDSSLDQTWVVRIACRSALCQLKYICK